MANPPFWVMANSLSTLEEISRLLERNPPEFECSPMILKQGAWINFLEGNTHRKKSEPLPLFEIEKLVDLKISGIDLDVDYIEQGGPFCSRKLRDIFSLDDETVQYIPVNYDNSSDNIRDKDYKIINVLARRNVIDITSSEVISVDFDHLGNPSSPRIIAVRKVVFDADATSDVPMFRDPNDQRIFVTDDFRKKVERYGIGSVEFIDVRDET